MDALIRRRDTVKMLILALLLDGLNQREIAKRLNLTPQAISEYFKELSTEGLIEGYDLTDRGLKWLIEKVYEVHMWSEEILKRVFSVKVIAIAVGDVKRGGKVRYWFEEGIVYCKADENYNAIALTDGKDEEVLIKPLSFKPPEKGGVVIYQVPDAVLGGSRSVDLDRLRELAKDRLVVALGVEALVACRKAGLNAIFFGSKYSCVEAVHHGCNVLAVCTQSLVKDLVHTLLDEGISFSVEH